MLEYAWLNLVFPMVSFIIVLLFGRRLWGDGAYVAILAVAISFLQASIILFEVLGGATYETSINWVHGMDINLGILVNETSALMLFIVTLISLLVHIFSLGYMKGDDSLPRYYAELSLFTASMIGLVIADNYLGIFMFFELVGLCSYLLIGFWHYKPSAASAAKKAFIVTRAGDMFFLMGVVLIFLVFGTFNFTEVHDRVGFVSEKNPELVTLIALLIFGGVVGKSAQFPLHTWLPDAMEGPTTVSALIHAATMVAAGIYLTIRTYPLFYASPTAMVVVAFVGGFTALFAATMGVVVNDIKRILAYSTISQYGYMVLALGVGGYTAGMFHLMNHAFFKALLFLAAGSVIHAVGTNDIFRMGALSRKMKITTVTFIAGSLALAGIPPFSGFFSKDEILVAAYNSGHMIPFAMGMLGVLFTSFYIFRLVFVAFYGKKRSDHHAHESPANMTVPLIILALLATFCGLLGTDLLGRAFEHFIHFEAGESAHGHAEGGTMVMVSSISLALLGLIIAYLTYIRGVISADRVRTTLGGVHSLLLNKYYLDDIQLFISDVIGLGVANIMNLFDCIIIDGIVNLISSVTVQVSGVLRKIQTGNLQTYASILVFGLCIVVLILSGGM